MPKEDFKKLCIKMDADKMRLSHILEVKSHFRSSPGGTPIQVEFYSGEQQVGVIVIDAAWGVQWSTQLEERISRISSFLSVDKILNG